MRELVLGDCHGGFKGLKQVLERSNFNYEKDKLIFLGDICDGWSETRECINELMKIKNLVFVMGNHDVWLLDWLEFGRTPTMWTEQGGRATLSSYVRPEVKISTWTRHRKFLKYKPVNYYIDDKNRIFVHGGISQKPIRPQDTDKDFLRWDRGLWTNRENIGTVENIKKYKEVYVGHTTTWNVSHYPVNSENVWFLDQGGGWEGKISLMDINTKELWQSDQMNTLYKDERGRM